MLTTDTSIDMKAQENIIMFLLACISPNLIRIKTLHANTKTEFINFIFVYFLSFLEKARFIYKIFYD